MTRKPSWYLFCAAIAIAAFSPAAFADCQASQNCALCNAGSFTVMCQCKTVTGFSCTTCTSQSVCTGVGCCCGVTPDNKTHYSAFACTGTGTCLAQVRRNKFLIASNGADAVAEAIAAQEEQSKAEQSQSEQSGSEQSQTDDLLAQANILNLDPPISIGSTLGSGIAISDVTLKIDSRAVNGLSYKIRNNNAKAMVAFGVGFDIYWDTSPETPLHASSTQDGWFLGSNALESNQEQQELFTSSVAPQKPMRILRIEAVLDYAEFSDGSVYGLRAAQLAKKFAEVRGMKLDVRNRYAELLRKGLNQQRLLEKLDEDLVKTNGIEHMALLQMRLEFVNHGSEHLASKLLESRSLPILNIVSN